MLFIKIFVFFCFQMAIKTGRAWMGKLLVNKYLCVLYFISLPNQSHDVNTIKDGVIIKIVVSVVLSFPLSFSYTLDLIPQVENCCSLLVIFI